MGVSLPEYKSESVTEDGGKSIARRDAITLGITAACIIMFVGTGGPVLGDMVRSVQGIGLGPDRLAINAVLLNIALLVFSWRRYAQLNVEVAERLRAEEQARISAETDPLTGCLNRRSLAPATQRVLRAAEARGDVVAMLMVDLDNFKQINDYHGHSVGDAMLQEMARRIVSKLPTQAVVARLGGDEFACAVPFAANRSDTIDRMAAAIIESISQPVKANGIAVEMSVAVGITRSDIQRIAEDKTSDPMVLLHMADIAMFHAKRQGRNRYFWFEAPMESELRFRNELENGIRSGIPAGEFIPYYEQQIDLNSGNITGFEMLARWQSPSLGMVSPEVFIPVAEEIGVIAELSEYLIARALQDAREWDPKLSLSVNISPVQLRDPWFAQRLLKLLVTANFPPSRLEIEITESCLHENVGVVRTLITSLKNQGIRVSLDDFGTGYSSLTQLRTLPFDQIKIDRSFVTNMHECSDSATIVKAITALGQGLGLPITAEGIECENVLERLRALGEIKGQGYLYGRPENAADTQGRLKKLDLMAEKAERPARKQAPAASSSPASRKRAVGEA